MTALRFISVTISFFLLSALNGQTNVSGTLTTDTNWTLDGSPYTLTGDVVVNEGTTLTINAGVEIIFPSPFLEIYVNGNLQANGTSTQRILFRGSGGDQQHGGGLYLLGTGIGSATSYTLRNVDFVHLGDTGSEYDASLVVADGNLIIENVSVEDNESIFPVRISPRMPGRIAPGNSGIDQVYVYNNPIGTSEVWPDRGIDYIIEDAIEVDVTGSLTISSGVNVLMPSPFNNVFVSGRMVAEGSGSNPVTFRGSGSDEDHGGGIIYFSGSSGSLDHVVLEHLGDFSSRYDVALYIVEAEVSLSNVQVIDSEVSTPVWTTPRSIPQLDIQDASITEIYVTDENISDSLHWKKAPVPYVLTERTRILTGAKLSIAPGTQIECISLGSFLVEGALLANGTPAEPISFKGKPDATSGGLAFFDGSTGNILNEVTFSDLEGFFDAGYAAVAAFSGSRCVITSCRFEETNRRAIYTASDQLVITNSCFSQATTAALTNVSGTSEPIDARNNYWNSATGPFNGAQNPNGGGVAVSNNVLFEPWLDACPEVIGNDLAITEILKPDDLCIDESFDIVVAVNNFGLQAINSFQLRYEMDVVDGETLSVNEPLLSGERREITLATNQEVPPGANYNLSVTLINPGDQRSGNNVFTKTIEAREVFDGTTLPTTTRVCAGTYVIVEATGGETYLWSNGRTSSRFGGNYFETTVLTVAITNDIGCVDVDTVEIIVDPLPERPVVTASAVRYCPGGFVTLTSSISENIRWSNGAFTQSITVDEPGSYFVTHVDPNTNCESTSFSSFITEAPVLAISFSGSSDVCLGDSRWLSVFGAAELEWSTGETTRSITVTPDVTTVYTVTATDSYGCTYELSQTVTVSQRVTPGPVTGMLPLDGSIDVPTNTTLSWMPAPDATHYDLYIWRSDQSQPSFPSRRNIFAINFNIFGLQAGVTYSWFVVSANACEEGVAGPVQTFTAATLPDLLVQSPEGPSAAFSGEEISITWRVVNQGDITTGERQWQDYVYLSTDPTLSSDDRFIGRRENTSALSIGGAYNSSLVYRLPDCLEGDYYVIVRANGNRALAEINTDNNSTASQNPVAVSLSPKPDLRITRLVPPGTAGILQEGQPYTLTWDVLNDGTAPTSGSTRSARIYYNRTPTDNPFDREELGRVNTAEIIPAGETRTYELNFTLPPGLTDTVYLYVLLDFTDVEEECLFEENNREFTGPLRIIEAPRPDFEALALNPPGQVNSGQSLDVNWSVRNAGIPYSGSLNLNVLFAETDQPGSFQRRISFSTSGDFPTGVTRSGLQRITIPGGISGQKVIALEVNPGNQIDEGNNFDTGNYFNTATEVLVPDLAVVSPATNVTSVTAGEELLVDWQLSNDGNGSVTNTVVRDEVLLVNAGVSGFLDQAVTLQAGQNRPRQLSLRIPTGTTPGNYLLRVRTNSNQAVFEDGATANNEALAGERIRVLAPSSPDLVPLSVTATPTAVSRGGTLTVTYSARNNGTSVNTNNWRDNVYLSRNTVFSLFNSVYLGTRLQSRQLVPSATYTETVTYPLPENLVSGGYYVHIVTDAGNQLFERNELNNTSAASNRVEYDDDLANIQVNLRLRDVTSDTLIPGQPIELFWRTSNVGASATVASSWKDELFVSPDTNYDPGTDLRIGSWTRNGGLTSNGGTYSRLETFTIPDTLSLATYYLILVTDAEGVTRDRNRADNVVVLSTGEDGDPTVVEVGPKPDLTVSIDAVLDPAVSGQPLRVAYTVTNDSEVRLTGNGRDQLVVGGSQAFNLSSQSVGFNYRNWDLESGAFYRDTIRGFIPIGVSDNNFLVLKTDAGRSVAESDELNNTDFRFVLVTLPLPGDLAVQQVVAPATAQTNDSITINWTLINQGDNPLAGLLEQSIYLSRDQTWDITDPEVGRWRGTVDLAVNGTVNLAQEVCLTNVSDGDYFAIVRTDVLDNIVESDNGNNDGASPFPIDISMPELFLDVPENVTLSLRKPLYYRFVVEQNQNGETVRISLNSPEGSAVNELYVRYDSVPTRTVFDVRYDVPFEENQEVILSELTPGTYYIMAYAAAGPPAQNVTLLAKIVPFALTSVNSSVGGNTGPVTVELRGTRFAEGMTVFLDNGPGGTIGAANVLVRNTQRAFVTFELAGVQLGTYDVKAISGDGTDDAALLQSFRITSGTNPTSSPTLSCSYDGGSPLYFDNTGADAGAGNPLALEKIHPAYARSNQKIALTFRYVNEGNVDVVLPRLLISSLGGAPLSLDPELFDPESLELGMEFQETEGPPNILRPGGRATYTVYTHATAELFFRLF